MVEPEKATGTVMRRGYCQGRFPDPQDSFHTSLLMAFLVFICGSRNTCKDYSVWFTVTAAVKSMTRLAEIRKFFGLILKFVSKSKSLYD
jgi:hypothetical protein